MKQSEELFFVVCVFFAAASVRTVRGLPEPSAGLGDEVRLLGRYLKFYRVSRQVAYELTVDMKTKVPLR